jgi:transcriptional regulator with XRE-family HTH domain
MPVRKRDSDATSLGNRIREARQRRHWTQEDLAAAADLDRAYVGSLERGERNPSLTTLCRVAKALRVTLASLVEGLPR